jgi:Leucine-rich repeat (LRR) protein
MKYSIIYFNAIFILITVIKMGKNCVIEGEKCSCIEIDSKMQKTEMNCDTEQIDTPIVLDLGQLKSIPNKTIKLNIKNKLASLVKLSYVDNIFIRKIVSLTFVNCRIQAITKNIFNEIILLKNLFLSGKGIEEIKEVNDSDFKYVGTSFLQEVDLSKNVIKRLQTRIFEKLTNVVILTLDENQIEMIQVGLFSNLSRLEILYMDNNNIFNIEFDGLRSLKKCF